MISIYKTKVDKYIVYSDHEFFRNKNILFSYKSNCVRIWLPTLDYRGKVRTTSYVGGSDRFRQFAVVNSDLVPGKYEIDLEESSEDNIVAYLNEK